MKYGKHCKRKHEKTDKHHRYDSNNKLAYKGGTKEKPEVLATLPAGSLGFPEDHQSRLRTIYLVISQTLQKYAIKL